MSNLLTIIFLIIRIISNPIANMYQKKLSENVSSSVINFYTYLILSIICIPFCSKYMHFSSYNKEVWLSVIIAGLMCALGTVFLIKAVNKGELSVIGPINSYKSIIGLISGFILLKELPSFIDFIGILLIITGSYFIFDTTNEGFTFKLFKRKDIQYRIAALVLTGIEAAILKNIILMTSVEECFIFWCLSGLFWSFIIVLASRKKLYIKEKKYYITIFYIAICLSLMQYSTNYVFNNINVGSALALFQLSSIITVILGYKVFRESDIMKKTAGTIIMITGSCLIIL